MKNLSKLLSILLVAALLLSSMAGCGSEAASGAEETAGSEPAAVESTAQEEAAQEEPAEAADPEPAAPESAEETEAVPETVAYFPLDEPESISYWTQLNPEASSLIDNLADTPGYEYLAELLNVTFDFVCVSSTAATEQFSLMIASQDYCDLLDGIVSAMGGGYAGGPTKAYEDGVILDLTEYIEQYCPNYTALLTESGQMANAKTDDGQFLVFYPINTEFMTLTGVTIRKDLLDGLGMDVPVTYDDYAEFARAVKSEYGISDPIYLSSDTNSWVMGHNVTGFAASTDNSGVDHIFHKDGVVTSSFLEDDYKEYLQLMNEWYNEGLINAAFYERSSNIKSQEMEAFILNGNVGVYPNDANSIQNHEGMASVELSLVGAGWPRVSEDDVVHVSNSLDKLQQMGAVCVSTDCENYELVFRFIDWFYTDEAMMLAAFGPPDHYVLLDDGTVEHTEEALELYENNMWDTTANNAKGFYRAGIAGKKTQLDMFTSWGMESVQTEAVYLWNSENYDDTWLMPSTLSLSTEESEVIAEKSSDIATYAAETISGFVTGDKSFDEWDDFVQNIKDMGLQDIIDAYQSALDRYYQR